VRYADNFIVGFQHRAEAERFLTELREGGPSYRRAIRLGIGDHDPRNGLIAMRRNR
jgi:hypothetical protein